MEDRMVPPKRVLIAKLNHLGDTVCFLPTINAIRKSWPKTHLTLLTTNIGKELIDGSNLVDEIWVSGVHEIKTLSGFWPWLKIAKRDKFDIAVASEDTGSFVVLLFFFSLIPLRIGFTSSKLWFLFNRKIPPSTKITNLELNFQIAKCLGLSWDRNCLYPVLPICEADKMIISGELRRNAISNDAKFAVLHLGSNRPSRRWFIERYAQVVQFLAEKHTMKTVCIGGKEEKNLVSHLRKLVKGQYIVDLCGETSIKQLVYLISLSDLYIGHSSGPLHIAYMLGIPSVSLWGASSPVVWGPAIDRGKHVCIKVDIDCIHCEQVVCPKERLECMEQIKTDRVIEEISRLLERYNKVKGKG